MGSEFSVKMSLPTSVVIKTQLKTESSSPGWPGICDPLLSVQSVGITGRNYYTSDEVGILWCIYFSFLFTCVCRSACMESRGDHVRWFQG